MSRRVTRLPWDTDDRALHTHCAMLFDAVETSETLITEHCTLCGAVHWTFGTSAFCKCVISLCMISSVIFYATMSGNALTEAIFSSWSKTRLWSSAVQWSVCVLPLAEYIALSALGGIWLGQKLPPFGICHLSTIVLAPAPVFPPKDI